MPSEKGDMQAVSLWIDKDLVEKLDKFSEKAGITRSKLCANIIRTGVEEIEFADKIGFMAFALVIRDLTERWRKRTKKTIEQE